MLRWLCDAIFVLKFGLSSPVTRCEPSNYCRWVKAKNRNSVCVRVRARAFSPVSPTLLLASAWVSDAMEAIGEKLPDKSKKCPRPEAFAPPFFGRNGVARTSAGGLGDCAALFLRGARRVLLPLPARLHTSGSARFVAERNSRCQEPQPRRLPVFLSVFAILRAPVPLFSSSFFEERAERGTIS